jgi:hypothetical protein
MDTETTRVTRVQAALLVNVSERTINRWSSKGWITVHRPYGAYGPAEYDVKEVQAAAARSGRIVDLDLPSG